MIITFYLAQIFVIMTSSIICRISLWSYNFEVTLLAHIKYCANFHVALLIRTFAAFESRQIEFVDRFSLRFEFSLEISTFSSRHHNFKSSFHNTVQFLCTPTCSFFI